MSALAACGFAAAASPTARNDRPAVAGDREPVLLGGSRAYASPPARTLPVPGRTSRPTPRENPPNRRDTEIAKKVSGGIAQEQSPIALPREPAPGPVFTFEGISSAAPGAGGVPDANGDVGTDHYVQMVNKLWAVYDKAGALVGGPFAENSLWQGATIPDTPCKSAHQGDPVVLFDEISNRWLLSFFAFTEKTRTYECVAISKTSSPLGSWWLYTFDLSQAAAVGTGFADYPKLGVWPDAYYMSANLFPAAGGQDGLFVAFERQQMLNGGNTRFFALVDTSLSGNLLPADLDGAAPPTGSPGYFLVPDPNAFTLRLYRFAVDWAVPTASVPAPATIPVQSYDPAVCTFQAPVNSQCVHQPGTTVKLDPIDNDQLMFRLAYRNFGTHESLIATQTIDVLNDATQLAGRAGIRWYEVRSPRATPVLYQQGTFAPDATHRFVPAAAADKYGNIVVGYNVSDATSVYPGIRYAARRASDPLGQLPLTETTLVAGGGSKTVANTDGRARWGDYNAMSVDPVDGCTFWFTGEYLAQNGGAADWNTRVAVFRLPQCGPVGQPQPQPQPPPPPPPAPPPPPPQPKPVIRTVSMSMRGPRANFQRERTFQVTWGAVANAARYDVRFRRARFRGIFGGYRNWRSNTPVTSASFTGKPGTSYCFQVRTNPRSGFISNWSGARCTAVPIDDFTLVARGRWTRYYRAGGRYLNTFSQTKQRGASLSLRDIRATRLALVATKCSRCGTVAVYWNNRRIANVRLTSSSRLYKQIIEVASFASQQRGNLRIVVTSAKRPVQIEGLGISS